MIPFGVIQYVIVCNNETEVGDFDLLSVGGKCSLYSD